MKRVLRPALLIAAIIPLAILPALAQQQPKPDLAADARLAPSDPPPIPHAVKPSHDGDECNACHRGGLKNAPPTSHPERLNCTSCHVQGEVKTEKKSKSKGKKR